MHIGLKDFPLESTKTVKVFSTLMDILYCILEISKTFDILEKGSCSYRKHRMFREQFPSARITLCLGTCKFEFANCFHRNPLEVKGGQHAKPTKRKFTFCYTRCTTRQYHISIWFIYCFYVPYQQFVYILFLFSYQQFDMAWFLETLFIAVKKHTDKYLFPLNGPLISKQPIVIA